jgi:hypothetical protein
MTIHAAFFEGYPIGPQIAFFDDMNAQQPLLGDADCRAVQRPAIAEQNDVADRLSDNQLVEKFRPFLRPAAKVDGSRKPPEGPVAAIEIDTVNRVAALGKRPPEALKKTRRHSL